MPRIPNYQSQARMPETAGTVPVPVGPAMLPGEAAAKGFGKLSDVAFDMNALLARADQAGQLSKAMADSAVELGALRDKYLLSPDFNLDPAGAATRFNSDVQEIGRKTSAGIQDHMVRQHFDEHFSKSAATQIVQFGHDATRAKVNLLQGDNLRALEALKSQAAVAPTDTIFRQHLGSIRASLAGAVASGVWSADQAERLRQNIESGALLTRANLGLISNPARVAAEIAERKPGSIWADLPAEYVPHLLTSAESRAQHLENEAKRMVAENAPTLGYNYVYDAFQLAKGGDIGAAVEWLNDPENARKAGLPDVKAVREVQNMLYTQGQHRQIVDEQRKRAAVERFNQDALGLLLKGSLDVGAISSADVPYDIKKQWLDVLARRGDEEAKTHDQRLYNQIMVDIHSEPGTPGRIENLSQVLPYVASGKIGAQKLSEINAAITTANDPTRSPFIAQAKESFMARFADTPQMRAMFPRFLEVLHQHIRAEGLKGEQITKRALTLMQDAEEGLWSSFKNWLTNSDTTQQWQVEYNEGLQMPAPGSPAPIERKPQIDPRIMERVQSLRAGGTSDQEIGGFLMQKGIDPALYGLQAGGAQ